MGSVSVAWRSPGPSWHVVRKALRSATACETGLELLPSPRRHRHERTCNTDLSVFIAIYAAKPWQSPKWCQGLARVVAGALPLAGRFTR